MEKGAPLSSTERSVAASSEWKEWGPMEAHLQKEYGRSYSPWLKARRDFIRPADQRSTPLGGHLPRCLKQGHVVEQRGETLGLEGNGEEVGEGRRLSGWHTAFACAGSCFPHLPSPSLAMGQNHCLGAEAQVPSCCFFVCLSTLLEVITCVEDRAGLGWLLSWDKVACLLS